MNLFIKNDDGIEKIYVNEFELKGVTSYSLKNSVDQATEFTVTLLVSTVQIEIE